MKVTETLTMLDRMLWVIDNATVAPLPDVDEAGKILPLPDDAPDALPVIDVLEAVLRPSKRGVQKVGLTLRVWVALFFVAASRGRATVVEMHKIATGELPRELQWDLGILTCNCPGDTCAPTSVEDHGRMLTERQLYRVTDTIDARLDPDAAGVSDHERASRIAALVAMQDAFLHATHVIAQQGSSLAVDESGIWSWFKGRRKPTGMPDVDPTDHDANDRGAAGLLEANKKSRKAARPLPTITAPAPAPAPVDEDADFFDQIPDEDGPEVADGESSTAGGVGADTASADRDDDGSVEGDSAVETPQRVCSFSRWGVKTHKNGKQSAYFGYALHALIRVPEIKRGGQSSASDEPLLIQQFAITPASTDVVDVTLGLVKKILAAGGAVGDLLGDRHYSYKKFDRWALPLWLMGVKPVLDLRKDDHKIADYNGAQIIAGTPHCGVPAHLIKVERPGKGAPKVQWDAFNAAIEEREQYAMRRHKAPQGDGKTRWICPPRAGCAGCPRIEGSLEIARKRGLPIITPPEGELPWCGSHAPQIPAHPVMKYQQEEYWGTEDWEASWNRRTYIESAFGNLKNHHTGNIHRGYTCLTGRALVTFAYTAAVVAYNLRELESWHERATKLQPNNPLLAEYAAHPLHQRTIHVHGFTMLSKQTQIELDSSRSNAA